MKTTLDIPDELLAQLRERAARDGREIDQVAALLLADALANGGPNAGGSELISKSLPQINAHPVNAGTRLVPPIITKEPDTGLPVIRGAPDAPISRMTAEEIQAIIDQTQLEEDLDRLGVPPGH